MNQTFSTKNPLVSIITPTFNRGELLEKAIQNIMNQDYENIEHMVVDGASTDNTLEILKKHEGKYNLKWISEKDKNEADARNKALKIVKGEIIGFCHSDDFYAPGAIKKVVKAFIENPEADIVFGNCQEFDYSTSQYTLVHQRNISEIWNITPEDILFGPGMYQPSTFYKRSIIDKTGHLDINHKFTHETDWWCRMANNKAKVYYIKDSILAIIGVHKAKGGLIYADEVMKETITLVKSYGRKVPFRMRLSYLRWKYFQTAKLFKIIQGLKPLYKKIFPDVISDLKRELSDCDSVLDLGCGPNSVLQHYNISHSTGVDLFKPYLEESKKRGIHNQYILEDVRKVDFKPNSFDAVITLSVVEHLNKNEGYKLMSNMEKWAKKKIVVLVPNGYVNQDTYDNNPLQKHQSGWVLDEFTRLGFKVRGINGLKQLRAEDTAIKYKPRFFWTVISDLTQIVTHSYPRAACQLLAIKKIKK